MPPVSTTPVANLPPVSFIPVASCHRRRWHRRQICRRYRWHRWQICHRCQQHKGNWWQNLPPVSTAPWLANISSNFCKKFEVTLLLFLGAGGRWFLEKTWSKKSRDTVPLNNFDGSIHPQYMMQPKEILPSIPWRGCFQPASSSPCCRWPVPEGWRPSWRFWASGQAGQDQSLCFPPLSWGRPSFPVKNGKNWIIDFLYSFSSKLKQSLLPKV